MVFTFLEGLKKKALGESMSLIFEKRDLISAVLACSWRKELKNFLFPSSKLLMFGSFLPIISLSVKFISASSSCILPFIVSTECAVYCIAV